MEIIDTFIQAAHGLKAMHAMGYAHCDIKPNNILRNDHGQVKVIDFGQAAKSARQGAHPGHAGLHRSRAGCPPADQRADRCVQSRRDALLGPDRHHIPTLYTVNKKGDNSFLLDRRIETAAGSESHGPAGLSNLVMECVSTRPAKRPADMDQVIIRLELIKHILTSKPTASSDDSTLGQTA